MGTRGMDDLFHELRLYGASRAGGEVASRKFMNATEKRTAVRPPARRLPETVSELLCGAVATHPA
jgi:hypothetical protein